mgnify:CR=1 FL=1
MKSHTIAVTMGDAAGIGPEIIAKLFRDQPAEMAGCVVAGDMAAMQRAARCIGGLLPLAVLWLLPFYLMIRNALMTQAEISSFEWAWWPAAPQWSNFQLLFDDPSAPMASGLPA